MPITTLIIDDEPLARDKIRGFLQREDDFEVIGECRDGMEALAKIEELRPDLIFLDVQMPELDGFGVLENLDLPAEQNAPIVVFTTAYDQYALKAFEVHAIDYLLKPFDRERFQASLARVRGESERREAGAMREQLQALLSGVRDDKSEFPERLVVRNSGRVVFVRVDEIDWIDAAGNYVKIHAGEETFQLRETMSGIEKRLDPQRFLRIHRSTIVHIDRIRELEQRFHGDYIVVLNSGQRLTLSRSYRDRIQDLLEQSA